MFPAQSHSPSGIPGPLHTPHSSNMPTHESTSSHIPFSLESLSIVAITYYIIGLLNFKFAQETNINGCNENC